MSAVKVGEVQADEEFQNLLIGALQRSREKRDAERPKTQRDHLYASEVGTVIGESACWRKIFYDFHGAPKDSLTPETMLAFEIGDVIGLRVANILAADDQIQKVELKLSFDGYPVTGRLDALLSSKWKRVVEIKSIPYRAINYIPKEEHIRQTNLYVHQIRQDPEFDDFDGTLVYLVKDAAKGQPVCRAFEVPYNKAMAEETLLAFVAAKVTASDSVLPARPSGFTISRFPCAYCSFKTHCWSSHEITDKKLTDEVPF